MKQTTTKRSLSAFAGFAAMALFGLCVLCVVLAGAGTYRRLTARGQEAYVQRTCAQYLTTRVRQSEGAHSLWVEPFGDTQALVLAQTVEEARYLTRIYCHDGWLMELFSQETMVFAPEDGEKLLPAQSLTFVLEEGILQARLTDELGQETRLTFALRGGEGDGA